MHVLSFDTSSSNTAVAVTADDRVLAEDDSPAAGRHAELLLPRVRSLLEQAGLSLLELDLIAVGLGPGSFTGLRVGLATAKGLALALPVALCGVDSLAALARGARSDAGLVMSVLDAAKGEVFAAAYRFDADGEPQRACDAFHAEPDAAARRLAALFPEAPAVLCGDGARRYHDVLSPLLGARVHLAAPECDVIHGRHVAALGRAQLARSGPSDVASLEPSYLRGSDARLPRRPLSL